jgi:hypothetical protein
MSVLRVIHITARCRPDAMDVNLQKFTPIDMVFSTGLYKETCVQMLRICANNIVGMVACNSHYIHCSIKELGTHFPTQHTSRRHLRKRKSWTIIGLFYVPLEFQPKMKNWIYHHSTGFLNYLTDLSRSSESTSDSHHLSSS